MDIPAKKLAKLLTSEDAAIRASAAVVAGELAIKDVEISSNIFDLLADPSSAVRIEAIRAAGKLKVDKAMPLLLEKIAHGGPEGDASAKACATLGAKGVKALHELLHKVVPGVRKYIAAALAEADVAGADEAGVSVFKDADASVAEAAASAMTARIPQFSDKKKNNLAAELVKLATAKKPALPAAAEPAVLRLLSALQVQSTANFFWDRTQPPHHPDIRSLALKTIGGWVTNPSKIEFKKLMTCACEQNFQIVGPALVTLDRLQPTAKLLDDWLPLFDAPDVGARRLAVNKLGDFESAGVADGLLNQLTHHDRGIREAARAKLLKSNSGRQGLVKALLETDSNEECWGLSRSMASVAKQFTAKQRKDITDRLGDMIEKNSHLIDPFMFFLREADANGLRDQLFDMAVENRRKKKYELALPYLKLLGRDPAAGFNIRFELACVGLKISKKDLSRESRVNDACLTQFAHAANADMAESVKQLEKAKFIDADDLFYIGFHFAEDLGRLKNFGADCLKLCIKLSPKGKVAQNAKTKLKSIVLS